MADYASAWQAADKVVYSSTLTAPALPTGTRADLSSSTSTDSATASSTFATAFSNDAGAH